MKISSYGLFWRADEINWNPGTGQKGEFRLLGRIGAKRGTIQAADFRHQQGIYVLFDNYGVAYVGLTRQLGLGARLKNHLHDHLEGCWDRFCWFGFREISRKRDQTGVCLLKQSKIEVKEETSASIGDLEALLIRLLDPKQNTSRMNFTNAKEWVQIDLDEREKYLSRLN